MPDSFQAPHGLVLGGGGILGEAWMTALLAGLEESVEIRGRSYVDGGAWSPTNMDAVPARHPRAVP